MSAKNAMQGKTYRVNLRLDTQTDAEVIAWLESLPSGRRSTALREVIRLGLGIAAPTQPSIDLETIRQVFADELTKALTGLQFQMRAGSSIDTQHRVRIWCQVRSDAWEVVKDFNSRSR